MSKFIQLTPEAAKRIHMPPDELPDHGNCIQDVDEFTARARLRERNEDLHMTLAYLCAFCLVATIGLIVFMVILNLYPRR